MCKAVRVLAVDILNNMQVCVAIPAFARVMRIYAVLLQVSVDAAQPLAPAALHEAVSGGLNWGDADTEGPALVPMLSVRPLYTSDSKCPWSAPDAEHSTLRVLAGVLGWFFRGFG